MFSVFSSFPQMLQSASRQAGEFPLILTPRQCRVITPETPSCCHRCQMVLVVNVKFEVKLLLQFWGEITGLPNS